MFADSIRTNGSHKTQPQPIEQETSLRKGYAYNNRNKSKKEVGEIMLPCF